MKYLNSGIVPFLYTIYFKININNNKFSGKIDIHLKVNNKKNSIQFHGLNLDIINLQINNQSISLNNLSYDKLNNIYTIDYNLELDDYVLSIEYNGLATDDEDGLIRYVHKKSKNITLYTRFEPIAARRCYPCWDEPSYKVKYNTSIEINDKSYNVLYNTDPLSINNIDDNNILYKFAETIPMCTYLSSFIISKFRYIEAISKHQIRLRVYIPTYIEDLKCGDFALECGIRALNYIIDYLDLTFPYNKIDFIPINDTSAAGMENYGLIFYELDSLLFNSKNSTLGDKRRIAHVIAHELAHQWFGNILSINKWNNLWLKESFANYFEHKIICELYPSWDTPSYNIMALLKTLEYDSLCMNTIRVKKVNIKYIESIYNKLTYTKGGNLLNAINSYIGEEQFKTNIRMYVNKYQHQIINNELFINSICENLSIEIKTNINILINQYINVSGYPIIIYNKEKTVKALFNSIQLINNSIQNTIQNTTQNTIQNITQNYTHNEKILLPILSNNKYLSYMRIVYDKTQFIDLISNIKTYSIHNHLSILDDLYIIGSFKLCSLKFWIIYMHLLINLLLDDTYTNIEQFSYFLIKKIFEYIKLFNKIIKNNTIFNKLVRDPFNRLINKLNILFDIANIDIYQLNKPIYNINNINYGLMIFLLLDIRTVFTNNILYKMFDLKLFNLCGDINNIMIKRIIINNNVLMSKFDSIIIEYPHMREIIKNNIIYSKNKKIIEYIFNKEVINKQQIDYDYLIDIINANKYFVELMTMYYIENFNTEKFNKISHNNIKYKRLSNVLLIKQSNLKLINKLIHIIKTTDNINLYESKHALFVKLYQKFNILNIFNQYN